MIGDKTSEGDRTGRNSEQLKVIGEVWIGNGEK